MEESAVTPEALLLVAAYVAVWALVGGYVIWLVRRQERLRREIDALRQALEARELPSAGRPQGR